MADSVVGPGFDPLSPNVTPGAAGALAGDDDDAAERRERLQFFREQRKQLQQLTQQEQGLYAKREQEEAPLRQKVQEAGEDVVRTGNLATQKFLSGQADLPKFDANAARGDAFQWMSLAAGFGALAGAFSRYHTTTALNAFSGMMTGFAKGQLEVYQEKYQEWQANSERAHEYNARALREYRAIMDNAKLNLDVKSNMMEMTANKWQDQLMANSAQQRSLERMTQLMDAQDRFDQNLQFRKQSLEQHNDLALQKIDAQLAERGFKRDQNGKVIPDPDNPAVFDDKTIDMLVNRRLLGDKSVLQGIGRGTQGPANIVKFNQRLAKAAEERGITAQDLTQIDQQFAGQGAYQVAAGRYASRVENATNELQRAIPLAEAASKKYPRDNWVSWNKLMAMKAAGTSDPKYNDFIVKALAARNAYVRAMNPTGNPRIAERLELAADNILSTAVGPEGFSTQLRGMWTEAENSRAAVAETRGMAVPGMRPYPETGTAPAAGGGGGAGGNVIHYDSEGNPVQ